MKNSLDAVVGFLSDYKQPTIKLIGIARENVIWEVDMADGNRFRYSNGEMIPFTDNKTK